MRMGILLTNKKVKFDYEVLETFEAGVSLFGHEVKAVKAGKGSIVGARVGGKSDGMYLIGADIPAYQPGNTPSGYEPTRDRKLLLSKKEQDRLVGAERVRGQTLVPRNFHTKGKLVKVEVVLVRGKKKYDKRQTIKKREAKRDIERHIKGNR